MSGTRISSASIERAIEHICEYGDTDVFPHLKEIHFIKDKKSEIVSELSKLNLDSYQPLQSIEALAPKSRYGFRIANQLHFADTILFTASVIEIGEDLEKIKQPNLKPGPFSYRFSTSPEPSLFEKDHNYRDWLKWQLNYAQTQDFEHVIFSDIADFFQRIYFHRIENTLDISTDKKGIKRFIEKTIKTIRSRQSYGIPVGGSASRIIAEAILSDSDAALLDEGYEFTRFVDDFRIYIPSTKSPYEALSFFAEQLFLTEGLTLNSQKTNILTKRQYIDYLEKELPDETENAQNNAIETITNDIYFSEEEPDETLIEALKKLNLLNELRSSIANDPWDFGKIKSILRALRITQTAIATAEIIDRMDELLPFSKEIVLYFDELHRNNVTYPNGLKEKVVELASNLSSQGVPTIHAWLLEFFARGIIQCDHQQLKAMSGDNPTSKTQVNLIRGINGDVNYFRRHKTKFESFSPFTKYSFLLGASCLPKDEYEKWIGAIKGRMSGPLEKLYCEWAQSMHGNLNKIMENRIQE